MEQLLSHQAVDWREGRRLRAWELGCQGWPQKDIAAALGVTNGAVSQWVKRAKEEGPQGLRRRKGSGRPPRLTLEQRGELPRLLEHGPEAYGFRGALWTEGRIAQVIRQSFGVSYHPAHVGRILRTCGWSLQKPIRRATQRDEQAIRTWREERWPQVKKKPKRRSAPSSS
jgi:transposase